MVPGGGLPPGRDPGGQSVRPNLPPKLSSMRVGTFLAPKIIFLTIFLRSERPYLVRCLLRRFATPKMMIFQPSEPSKIMPLPQ